jgi:tRNA(adenine34) deaminase
MFTNFHISTIALYFKNRHEDFMTTMLKLLAIAKVAAENGEVPIAAAIVGPSGIAVATYHNEVEQRRDATAHAELLAIQMACKKLGRKTLEDYTLVVTLEPCAMCAQAAAHAKIGKIIFGAYDVKGGGVEHGARIFRQKTCHHKPEVIGGVMEAECGALLKDFFKAKRD